MEVLITVAIVITYNKGREHSVGYEYLQTPMFRIQNCNSCPCLSLVIQFLVYPWMHNLRTLVYANDTNTSFNRTVL
jgi:hypothetical protein